MAIEYIRASAPHDDILIVTGQARQDICELADLKVETTPHARIFHNASRSPVGMVSGIVHTRANMKIGLEAMNLDRARSSRGRFWGLFPVSNPDGLELISDTLGNIPIYYARTSKGALASNSIRLIALAMKSLGLPIRLSLQSIATTWFTSHIVAFTQFSQETYVEGISICLIGQSLRFDAAGMTISPYSPMDTSPLEPGEYKHLLDLGLQEIRDNFIGLFGAGDPVLSTLTGGRDSRMLLAGILSLGREKEVVFRTMPTDEDDIRISTALANYYDLEYAREDLPVVAWHRSFDEDLRRHSLMHMGAKTLYIPTSKTLQPKEDRRSLTFVGWAGELYRSIFTKRFEPSLLNKKVNSGSVQEWLKGYGTWQNLSDEVREVLLNSALEVLNKMGSRNIGEALDMHYANFRNRHHFGATAQYNRDRCNVNVHPLMSSALFNLSRRIPRASMMSDRVVFDVTRSLDFELAFLPYDKPLVLPTEVGSRRAELMQQKLMTRFRPEPERLKVQRPLHVEHVGEKEQRSREEFVTSRIEMAFEKLRSDPVASKVLTPEFIEISRRNMRVMKPNHLSTFLAKLDAACEVIDLG